MPNTYLQYNLTFTNSLLGDDWDELERKAAKSDQKRADIKKSRGSDDDSDDDRTKKKKAAPKANGKKPVKSKR